MNRVAVGSLVSVMLACTPEPASSVEMRQTVVEIVDQGRAMAIEDAMVALVGAVPVEKDVGSIADSLAAAATVALPCATIERLGAVAVRIDFGASEAPCYFFDADSEPEDGGIGFSGSLRVVYTRPSPNTLLASLYYEPLRGDATALDGTSELTWGADGSQRVVTEVRVDAVTERQVEVQSDRLLLRAEGLLTVDGWRRWQTLMGRWDMDLAGMVFAPEAFMPRAGLGSVATPFDHTIVLDFAREAGVARVRASGGRRDRIFEVTASGEVLDAGDG